jgi:hypothetical protein
MCDDTELSPYDLLTIHSPDHLRSVAAQCVATWWHNGRHGALSQGHFRRLRGIDQIASLCPGALDHLPRVNLDAVAFDEHSETIQWARRRRIDHRAIALEL